MKTNLIIFGSMAMSCLTMQAQQADSTLTQAVTVERAYSPVVQDANKINRQPVVEEVEVSHTRATFADKKSESVRPNELTSMNVGQVIATPEQQNDGFVSLSAGNYWNTDIKAGYRIGDFNFLADGFFTKGNLKTPYPLEELAYASNSTEKGTWNSLLGRGRLSGSYKHEFDDASELKLKASMGGTFANLMNYSIAPAYLYLDSSSKDYELALYQKQAGKNQRNHWGQVLLEAEYEADRYTLKAEIEHVGVKAPDDYENAFALGGDYLVYNNDGWLVTAGLNTALTLGKEDNYFTIKPEVEASYTPDSYSWQRLYAKLGIGTRRESSYSILERMPLVEVGEYKSSFDLFDLTLGWEDSQNGSFKYGASINLRNTRNDLNMIMCSNGMFDELALEGSPRQYDKNFDPKTVVNDNTNAILCNEDCFRMLLEAHFEAEINRYISAMGKISYLSENCQLEGEGEPRFTSELHLLGKVDKVKMDLSFQGGFNRKMSIYGIQDQYGYVSAIDLGNIADLGLRFDYQYNEKLSFCAFGNNLLNRKYQLWATIPAQGINLHVGAKLEF